MLRTATLKSLVTPLAALVARMQKLQTKLMANDERALLLVFQALDATFIALIIMAAVTPIMVWNIRQANREMEGR